MAALTGQIGQHRGHVVPGPAGPLLHRFPVVQAARAAAALSFQRGEVGAVSSRRTPLGSWK